MLTINLFLESIKSPRTKEVYANLLRAFAVRVGVTDVGLLPPEDIQNKLIEYVVELKHAGKSYSAQNTTVCAVQKFCDAYDINVNFKRVRKFMGEDVVKHEGTPYPDFGTLEGLP